MPRCSQFSEDRKEPSAERSRSATRKLGDKARAENCRNPEGVSVTCEGISTISQITVAARRAFPPGQPASTTEAPSGNDPLSRKLFYEDLSCDISPARSFDRHAGDRRRGIGVAACRESITRATHRRWLELAGLRSCYLHRAGNRSSLAKSRTRDEHAALTSSGRDPHGLNFLAATLRDDLAFGDAELKNSIARRQLGHRLKTPRFTARSKV